VATASLIPPEISGGVLSNDGMSTASLIYPRRNGFAGEGLLLGHLVQEKLAIYEARHFFVEMWRVCVLLKQRFIENLLPKIGIRIPLLDMPF
jgi:hypothetical protein